MRKPITVNDITNQTGMEFYLQEHFKPLVNDSYADVPILIGNDGEGLYTMVSVTLPNGKQFYLHVEEVNPAETMVAQALINEGV